MSGTLPIVLAASVLVASQGNQAKDQLTDTLLTMEKQSWDMLKRRDAEGLRRYATDNFLWIFADGSRVHKDGLERFVNSYELKSYAISEPEVIRFDAEAAVLVYRLTYTGGEKGKTPEKQTVWATSTYVRRGDAWKEILYQETSIKE